MVKTTKPVTCTTDGYEEFTSKEGVTSHTDIPSTGHKWSAWETSVNPTTEKEGEKVRECSVCHEKETEVLPKLKKETSDENMTKNNSTVTPTNQNTVKQTGTTKSISVKKIKLNKKKVTLKKDKTFKIKTTVLPKNATNKKVTYKSSNKKVATVSKSGKIKAKKKGKCTITVTSKDGKKKAKIKITVK